MRELHLDRIMLRLPCPPKGSQNPTTQDEHLHIRTKGVACQELELVGSPLTHARFNRRRCSDAPLSLKSRCCFCPGRPEAQGHLRSFYAFERRDLTKVAAAGARWEDAALVHTSLEAGMLPGPSLPKLRVACLESKVKYPDMEFWSHVLHRSSNYLQFKVHSS